MSEKQITSDSIVKRGTREISTTAVAGGSHRSSKNSRQATAVRAAAKRDSTGRGLWLSPVA